MAASEPGARTPEDSFADEVTALVRELTGASVTKLALRPAGSS